MNDSGNVPLEIMIAGSSMLQSNATYEEFIKKKITAENNSYNALKCFSAFNQKCMIEQNLSFCENASNFVSVNCKDDMNVISNNETSMKSLSDLDSVSILESDISTHADPNHLKVTDTSFEATDDESMAVEALRQLGGIYDDNITFSVLPCADKMQSSTDLCSSNTACKDTQLMDMQVCPMCRKTFDNEQGFQQHDCRTSEKKYLCNICSSSFFTKTDFQKHVDFEHPGTHRCNICNGSFHRRSSLTNHMKIHNYQPGRAITTATTQKQPEQVVESSIDNVWSVEQVLISEVTDNTVTSDALSSWNFNYNTVSQIIHNDVSQEVSSLEQEINSNFSQDTITNTLDEVTKSLDGCQAGYESPVKVETLTYVSEKSSDDSFPILDIPQMEITIRNEEARSQKKLNAFNWPESYECNMCGETFSNDELREQHAKTCLGSDSLLAPNIDQVAEVQDDPQKLSNARSAANKKPQVKVEKHSCPDCDKRFATKQKMYRHMWIHRKKVFTCELCAMTFKLQADLDKHRLSQHPADSPYVCMECGKSFASRQGLWEHGRVHGGGPAGLFRCTECGKTFTSRQGYLIHNRTHTGERPYGCRFCLKAFRDGGTLRKHERIHTGERPHVCPICMHDFNQKVVLREHVRWVHAANRVGNDVGMFVCQLCNIAVTDKEELCAHIVKHSDLMAAEAKDSNCNALARDKSTKRLRPVTVAAKTNRPLPAATQEPANKQTSDTLSLQSEFDIKPFDFSPDVSSIDCDICSNICGEGFSNDELREQHAKTCLGSDSMLASNIDQVAEVQDDSQKLSIARSAPNKKSQVKVEKHTCPDCDKQFTTKQKMYRHMWIHRKKIFTCELCAMTFKLQADLDKHRLSQHPADSPYVCMECGKTFTSRQGLWEHGLVHGGGPAGLFRCTECGKTFTSRQGYLIHNRIHTGERPYECRFCLKAFRDGGTLRKHERIHTGERPHVCPICMHGFNQKVVLREHVRWVHAANRVGNDVGMFVCQLCNIAVTDKEELCAHIVKHSDLMAAEGNDSNCNTLTSDKNTKRSPPVTVATKATCVLPAATQKPTNKETSDTLSLQSEFDIKPDIKPFDFSPDVISIECDMCGNQFSSQKELMNHVQIHI